MNQTVPSQWHQCEHADAPVLAKLMPGSEVMVGSRFDLA